MEWLIIILLALTMAVFRFFKVGNYFSPWFITPLVWFGILFMFQFQNGLLYPLGTQFYTCLLIWVPLFCSASLLTFKLLPAINDADGVEEIRTSNINYTLFNILFVITLIATPINLYRILQVVSMFDSTDLFYNLRLLAVSQEYDFGVVRYSYILNHALFVVALWQYPKVPLWKLLLILVMFLIGQFALMEKNGIFLLMVSTLFVLFEKQVIGARTIGLTLLAVVLLFFLINFSKEIKSDENAESMNFIDFIGVYILSPPVAFEFITEDLSNQFGAHTFQYFYGILNNLGIGNFIVNQRLQEWVWVPLPTNVYTIFMPFYQDFGYMGVAYFGILYGSVFGYIYYKFRSGSLIAACAYAFIAKVLFVQFYHEDFIMSIATFGQFFLLVIIICQTRIRWLSPNREKSYGDKNPISDPHSEAIDNDAVLPH